MIFIYVLFFVLLSSCKKDTIVFDRGNILSESQTQMALQITDLNPNNPNQVRLIYSYTYAPKTWDHGVSYDREHVWPESKLNTIDQKRDLQNIRACNIIVNNQVKANRKFIDTSGSIVYHTVDPDFFYPGIWDQGDVARIIMYMVMTYDDLDAKDMGLDHKTLIKWHEADPVDLFEQNRNSAISSDSLQGNINPFISYPDLAYQYFDQSSNLFEIWFIGLVIYAILMLTTLKYKIVSFRKEDLYKGFSVIFGIFSLICGFIWSWWGMLLILIGIGSFIYYGTRNKTSHSG
jgi:endonuclease I